MTSPNSAAENRDGYTILIVDDNKAHVRLLREAFRDSPYSHNICSVQNGLNALSYLYREGEYVAASQPDLILLDLNLPGKSGHEVLQEVKADPTLKTIPVVILSSSRRLEDIRESYERYANCYISKPSSLKELFRVVQHVDNFWFNTAALATA